MREVRHAKAGIGKDKCRIGFDVRKGRAGVEAEIVFNGWGPQFRFEPDGRLKIAKGERHRSSFGRKTGGCGESR